MPDTAAAGDALASEPAPELARTGGIAQRHPEIGPVDDPAPAEGRPRVSLTGGVLPADADAPPPVGGARFDRER
jgi:hypothetical protein